MRPVRRMVQCEGIVSLAMLCSILLYSKSKIADSRTNMLQSNVYCRRGLSGVAMVLGELPVPGCPAVLIAVGQGPAALAVGAVGGCLDIFTFIYPFSPLSPSL